MKARAPREAAPANPSPLPRSHLEHLHHLQQLSEKVPDCFICTDISRETQQIRTGSSEVLNHQHIVFPPRLYRIKALQLLMEVTPLRASGAFLPVVWGPEWTTEPAAAASSWGPNYSFRRRFVPLKRWSGKLFLWRSANPQNNPETFCPTQHHKTAHFSSAWCFLT